MLLPSEFGDVSAYAASGIGFPIYYLIVLGMRDQIISKGLKKTEVMYGNVQTYKTEFSTIEMSIKTPLKAA